MTVDGGSTVYLYDANNRLKESVTGAVMTIYSYDKNGNLLREQSPYAPASAYAHVFGGASSLALNKYDAFSRLVSSNTDSGDVYFTYLPDGLRRSKLTNSEATFHIWNVMNIVVKMDRKANAGRDFAA